MSSIRGNHLLNSEIFFAFFLLILCSLLGKLFTSFESDKILTCIIVYSNIETKGNPICSTLDEKYYVIGYNFPSVKQGSFYKFSGKPSYIEETRIDMSNPTQSVENIYKNETFLAGSNPDDDRTFNWQLTDPESESSQYLYFKSTLPACILTSSINDRETKQYEINNGDRISDSREIELINSKGQSFITEVNLPYNIEDLIPERQENKYNSKADLQEQIRNLRIPDNSIIKVKVNLVEINGKTYIVNISNIESQPPEVLSLNKNIPLSEFKDCLGTNDIQTVN